VKTSYLCHESANELLTFWCSWCPFKGLCNEFSTNIWRKQFGVWRSRRCYWT